MRVLHFYKTFYPATHGGVEQVIHQLAGAATGQGIEATVLAVQPRGTPAPAVAYRVETAPRDLQVAAMDLSLAAIGRFRRLARAADVIHYHYPWPYMDLLHFICRVKKPTVVTYHADIVRQRRLAKLYRPLQQLFLRSVGRIVATSPAYVASSPVLQEFRDKVDVIPLGIDRASYPAVDTTLVDHYRARYGESFFLFVGTLRQYKGLPYLLQAMQAAPFPLVIAGDGPERAALEAQAMQLGLANVHFTGTVAEPDKMALLQLCRALVLPSHLRSEALGVALLEAAMLGRPMVSTELGTGTSYVNRHGETGLVVPPADSAALRRAMQALWDDAALATQYGAAALARYEAFFTADKMVGAYAALYRKLAGRV